MTSAPGPIQPGQPAALTAVKACALAAACLLFIAVAVRLTAVVSTGGAVALLAVGVLAGYLLADFVSGTVHWFCDTFFAEDTPLIGRKVIRPFRDHHRHPAAITRYRLLEQDGTNYFLSIPLLWLAWRQGGVFFCATAWGFALGAMGTNLFHKWAHAERVPAGVRWLQRHRLILSPEAHAIHHRMYTGGYCVTTGWVNVIADRIDFFGRAERLVRLFGRRGRP